MGFRITQDITFQYTNRIPQMIVYYSVHFSLFGHYSFQSIRNKLNSDDFLNSTVS